MFHGIRHKGVKTTEDCRNASLISANISTRHNPRAGWAWLSRLSAYVCATALENCMADKRLAARGAALLVRGAAPTTTGSRQRKSSTTRSATASGTSTPTSRGPSQPRPCWKPDAALAAVIVFDQFSRNMFRGSAEAFATDRLALAVARPMRLPTASRHRCPASTGISSTCRSCIPKTFADQERCVALFEALAGDGVKYAIEHRDIIERFGRFPHRNRALGRPTTQAEQAFLAGHKGFGQ